jgi:hypothetical protein
MTNALDIANDFDSVDEVYLKVDEVIARSVEEGSPETAITYISKLMKLKELTGKALVRFIYQLSQNWEYFEESQSDRFIDYVHAALGVHKHTIERYVKVGDMLANEVPPQYQDMIEDLAMEYIYPVANAIDQGYVFEDVHWEAVISAPHGREVERLVRELKGSEPKSSALQLWLDLKGSLWVFTKDKGEIIGFLEIKSDSKPVQRAINRILKRAGIMEEE